MYMFHVVNTISPEAPLTISDLENAFIAGYAAGTTDGVSPEQLREESDRLRKEIKSTMDDISAMLKSEFDEEDLDA
jgi:hypothetical protein